MLGGVLRVEWIDRLGVSSDELSKLEIRGERNTGDTGGWRLKGDGRLGVVAKISHMVGM